MATERRLDLIDRKALGIGRYNPDAFPIQSRGYVAGWNGVISLLEQAPSVDAVEVVRCKDCDKSVRSPLFGRGWRFCKNNSQHHRDDHFCSYGERKDNG